MPRFSERIPLFSCKIPKGTTLKCSLSQHMVISSERSKHYPRSLRPRSILYDSLLKQLCFRSHCMCTVKLTKINQFSALVTFRHDNFFWLKANSPFCDSRCVLPWSEEHNDVKVQGEGLGDSTGRHANDTCSPLLFARVNSRVLQYKYLFARSIAPVTFLSCQDLDEFVKKSINLFSTHFLRTRTCVYERVNLGQDFSMLVFRPFATPHPNDIKGMKFIHSTAKWLRFQWKIIPVLTFFSFHHQRKHEHNSMHMRSKLDAEFRLQLKQNMFVQYSCKMRFNTLCICIKKPNIILCGKGSPQGMCYCDTL